MEYLLLPPDTTCLLQPVDGGVGRSLKANIRKLFYKWVQKNYMEVKKRNGKLLKTFKNPTKELVIEWVLEAHKDLKNLKISSSNIINNI